MSTFKTTLVLGFLLLTNACGASAVTASSRIEGGTSAGAGLGRIREVGYAPKNENPMFDKQPDNRATQVRETPAFRYESDCWRCR